jgi:hypothetical protein
MNRRSSGCCNFDPAAGSHCRHQHGGPLVDSVALRILTPGLPAVRKFNARYLKSQADCLYRFGGNAPSGSLEVDYR